MVQDLIPNDGHHIKGLARGYRVYNDVAMDANEMLRVQDTIFILDRQSARVQLIALLRQPAYLARSINNLRRVILTLVFDNATECILNRRVIALYKMMVHKAHRER